MKKLWGIRHLRYYWLSFQVHRFAWQCGMMGIGMGSPNRSDLEVLAAIWRGEH